MTHKKGRLEKNKAVIRKQLFGYRKQWLILKLCERIRRIGVQN